MRNHIEIMAIIFLASCQIVLCAQTRGEIEIKKEVPYSSLRDPQLKMDIAEPHGEGPFPALVFFHGGGWQQGDKSHMHKWIRKSVLQGYVGVSVAYRFAPEHKWPSQVEDAKEAIRFLRSHAEEYNIDESKIGVMGESAGGYLALMVGLTSSQDSLEGKSAYTTTSDVHAVVSFFSATDFQAQRQKLSPERQLEMQQYYGKSLEQVRSDFTGTTSHTDPRLAKISVITYVDPGDPPVLIFHGDQDPFVSVDHAVKLKEELDASKVASELAIIKGGGHGWTGRQEEETATDMFRFFDDLLKR